MQVYIKDVSIHNSQYGDKEVNVQLGFYLMASEMIDWKVLSNIDTLSKHIEEALNGVIAPPVKMVRNKLGAVKPSLIIERDE